MRRYTLCYKARRWREIWKTADRDKPKWSSFLISPQMSWNCCSAPLPVPSHVSVQFHSLHYCLACGMHDRTMAVTTHISQRDTCLFIMLEIPNWCFALRGWRNAGMRKVGIINLQRTSKSGQLVPLSWNWPDSKLNWLHHNTNSCYYGQLQD